MTITQTVEIPEDRRVIFEVPREVPAGKAKIEMKVISFVKQKEKSSSKMRLSKRELEEKSKSVETPHTDALLDILSRIDCDINVNEIRGERLAKYLQCA
ncbi:MAG: hypothetical protein FWC17_04515 [Treponema sp.]|nr:hypothetical protein [Treponema sp.]